jgi:hypothetical protein
MAFGFNGFPNTNFRFLGITIFGLILFCKSLREAVRPGYSSVRPASVQLAAPPSVEVLDVASMLLLEDFGQQFRLETTDLLLDRLSIAVLHHN